MTKTVELETKTIKHAPEPPRDTQWISPGIARATSGEDVPLQYDEDRQGWTWGTKYRVYSWEEYVAQFDRHFPLTEVPTTKHEIKAGTPIKLQPLRGRHVSVGAYSGCQDITFFRDEGDFELGPEEAAKLRDFLNEVVVTKG
jgi:hypothetical protein